MSENRPRAFCTQVRALPKDWYRLRSLSGLELDAQQMIWPPASVCAAGVEAVMRYACDEARVDYVPPSC